MSVFGDPPPVRYDTTTWQISYTFTRGSFRAANTNAGAIMEVWVGMATLTLLPTNVKRAYCFVGAFAGFAVRAETLVEAVAALCREFKESGFDVIGLDTMTPVAMLDRQLTDHEQVLVEASESYPVQFKNVHLHKGDV